jgi:hypothetical protein
MLTIRRRYDNAVFFGVFVVLNDKLRGWYAALDPTAVRDGIPGHEPGSLEHVDSFHALCATLIFATALAFNINAAAWSSHGSKYRLNLQVAYISAVAAWTHREMWLGNDWYVTYRGAATPKAKNGPRFLLRLAPTRVGVHDARALVARAEPARVRVRRAAAQGADEGSGRRGGGGKEDRGTALFRFAEKSGLVARSRRRRREERRSRRKVEKRRRSRCV